MGLFSIFKRKKKAVANTLPAVDRERLTAQLKATEKYAIEFTRQSSSKPIGMGASKIGESLTCRRAFTGLTMKGRTVIK